MAIRLKNFFSIYIVANDPVSVINKTFRKSLSHQTEFGIIVSPESRGKGVGRILVNALINDAKSYYENLGEKIRKLYLLTHEENKSAHSFYEKVGFKHEVTLKKHYYDGKDERVYSIFFKI